MDRFAAIVMPDEVFEHSDRCVDIGGGRLAVPYNAEGDCVFLDGGRCSIHETKPRDCREFSCASHGQFLRTHPAVAALLTRRGVPIGVFAATTRDSGLSHNPRG